MLKSEAIVAAGDNLSELNLQNEAQLLDEHLGMGDNKWSCVAELQAEHDIMQVGHTNSIFWCSSPAGHSSGGGVD